MKKIIINVLKEQNKTLNSYNFWIYLLVNKKNTFRKVFYLFFNTQEIKNILYKIFYIFFGLTILGINKTPKTKSSNGAIITNKDSKFIKS